MSCDLSHRKIKHPGETLDYTVDFSEWLTAGDTIALATWNVSGNGLLQVNATMTDTTITIWVEAGDDGATYVITATATTALGRVKQFQFEIRVRAFEN